MTDDDLEELRDEMDGQQEEIREGLKVEGVDVHADNMRHRKARIETLAAEVNSE